MKDELFALLRRAYDGHVTRNLGNAARPLEWRGRLTLFAAVTGAIDSYSSHADALGPRWLYLRLPELNAQGERQARRRARYAQDQLEDHRGRAARRVAECVAAASREVRHVELSEAAYEALGEAAQVAAFGRGSVKRSGYGRREIDGEAEREGTARLFGQLRHLGRSLVALALPEQDAIKLVTRAALDSMPLPRRKVLHALALDQPLTPAEIARRESSNRPTIARACEDLEALGGLTPEHAASEGGRAPTPWRLGDEEANEVVRVFERLDADETKTRAPTHGHTLDHGRSWDTGPPMRVFGSRIGADEAAS